MSIDHDHHGKAHDPQRELARKMLTTPCTDADHLHDWVKTFLGLDTPREAVCPGHDAPFEYLKAAYFEPAGDLVVWAPRGGGKTRLGAAATLLDLLHKPGVEVRILGGSLEQSRRMWEHLMADVERAAAEQVARRAPGVRASQEIRLANGSRAGVLAQSQRAVRGLRVQKLRCDEVELFDPAVWEAAQLVTKSQVSGFGNRGSGEDTESNAASLPDPTPDTRNPKPDAEPETRNPKPDPSIRGCVEAISTLHKPWGLMNDVVERARREGTRIIKWCVLEVLQRCPADRDCAACGLHDDCHGVAKTRCNGFVSLADVLNIKRRVSREAWDSEVMCRRPNVKGRVFPYFDRAVHVVGEGTEGEGEATERRSDEATKGEAGRPDAGVATHASAFSTRDSSPARGEMRLAMDFGFANPFVCLWIVNGDDGVVRVVDEYVQPGRVLHEHVAEIERRTSQPPHWPRARVVACDPAGAGRNEQTAESNIAYLKRCGYAVRHRGSHIQNGLELIRHALRPALGKPTLRIDARCERLIRAMEAYHYPETGGELPVKDGEHDHLIDALRYFFVNRAGTAARGGVRY
ncbi:MAG TPA: hypothetical protein VER17_17300 [Tepidisphaeraceae bacterium]|nr:hypothetical protein [Tepidisphaeraceae bacterium]